MRIGFITQLLWERYGPFWVSLLQDLEVEIFLPSSAQVLERMNDPRLRAIPSVAIRLAVAQALSMQDVELMICPALNRTESARGSGQDPWIASFPEALASSAGLPGLFAVPASLEHNLESEVLELLMAISHDHGKVRRVFERHRGAAKVPRLPEPRWQKIPGEQATVGLIAQPWVFSEKLLKALHREDLHELPQSRLEPQLLRLEGHRSEERLLDTDAEVLGAARLFNRRASIDRLLFLADKDSGADAWLASRVKKLVHKPLEVSFLQDLFSSEALLDTLVHRT